MQRDGNCIDLKPDEKGVDKAAMIRAIIGASQQWPGAINTMKQAADLPVSEVFSRPEFMVLDVGRAYPQGWPHNLFCVDIPHIHSADLSSQRVVFVSRQGAKP
jgi:hypothetical protein